MYCYRKMKFGKTYVYCQFHSHRNFRRIHQKLPDITVPYWANSASYLKSLYLLLEIQSILVRVYYNSGMRVRKILALCLENSPRAAALSLSGATSTGLKSTWKSSRISFLPLVSPPRCWRSLLSYQNSRWCLIQLN